MYRDRCIFPYMEKHTTTKGHTMKNVLLLAEGLLLVTKAYRLGYISKEKALAIGAEMEAAARGGA